MQKNKQYYDKFYNKYPNNVHDSSSRFLAVSKILKGSVLDVACGTGTLSKYFTGVYSGIDFSDVAINKARSIRRKDAVFYVGDFNKEDWSFPKKFDSVYFGEFLEHIEDDKQVFQNVLKNLNPNGNIVVSVPNGERVPDESHCRTFTVSTIRRDYSKYGKVVFHNWEHFEKRILFSIEPDSIDINDMSLVMIVKDEEKGLEKSIISALPIVDRVVISVDTKSSDRTAKIAKMYADELKFHKWEDDFSKARNFAQENVKSKWILFLDGHEYIESYGDFKEKMKSDVDGIFVTVKMESGMTFLYPRIYRSYIKFKNKIHNVNECKSRRVSPEFVIVHDRINLQNEESIKERDEQREMLLPKAMKEQIKENPKNARPYFHLANYYMMRHKIDDSIYYYKKAIKYTKSPDEKFLCYLHYGSLHLTKGHTFRALWSFKDAEKLMPERWESARVLGGFYLTQKNYSKAVEYFVRALEPNQRKYSYQPMQQNRSEIWNFIGHCFAKLDQNQKAIMAWNRAFELTDDLKQKKLFQEKIKLVKTLLPE